MPSMQISPRYRVADWQRLKFDHETDWQRAADIFEDRMQGRFFEIVGKIEAQPFAGFAVLAIDCLLIETLQQFREGVPNSRRKSQQHFVDFLTQTRFGQVFDNDLALRFYRQIRSGILHQGEVNENSLVRKGDRFPLIARADDGEGVIVNRVKFHAMLVRVFEDYLADLRNPKNEAARHKFKAKMDYICRLPTAGQI